ncbi:MAG: hypothetical protein ACP5NP_05790 [Acetobacteraceae bacterium]
MAQMPGQRDGGRVARAGRWEPGSFPLLPGLLLVGTGGLVLRDGLRTPAEAGYPWWGAGTIVARRVAFAVSGCPGRLLPASFAAVFLVALGDRRIGLATATALAGVMRLVELVVFHLVLQVQLPLLRWG